jgi:DNA polymerase-1
VVPAVTDTPSQSDSRPTVVLVDGHALVHQLFHAVGQMSAPDGRPTNAVFGFARDL